jgi:hypothetical protein
VTDDRQSATLAGFEQFRSYPLYDAIFKRRARRVSTGIREISAGSLSWHSNDKPHPLSPLEQAVLISVTGVTGITMPDMPTVSETGGIMLGSPMIEAVGRSAGSPDNAQATVFFMLDDDGTYLLRKSDLKLPPGTVPGPDDLIRAAQASKVRLLDHRLDYPRHYPYYVGRNRFVSNLPGSTVFVPVIDMTRQYINGLMYLLSQEDGMRPSFVDDWNFYRWAGCKKWVDNGFLNRELKLPLGMLGTWRIHIEADFLVQNLWLTIQAIRRLGPRRVPAAGAARPSRRARPKRSRSGIRVRHAARGLAQAAEADHADAGVATQPGPAGRASSRVLPAQLSRHGKRGRRRRRPEVRPEGPLYDAGRICSHVQAGSRAALR